jgi:hypothetical protein
MMPVFFKDSLNPSRTASAVLLRIDACMKTSFLCFSKISDDRCTAIKYFFNVDIVAYNIWYHRDT